MTTTKCHTGFHRTELNGEHFVIPVKDGAFTGCDHGAGPLSTVEEASAALCRLALEMLDEHTGTKIVHGWSTECGECGYGAGGWRNSPANEGKPPLRVDSTHCPGCGCRFTEQVNDFDPNLSPMQKLLVDD